MATRAKSRGTKPRAVKRPRATKRLKPIGPNANARAHPNLTRNPHVNEHLTFCALHNRLANDSTVTANERRKHREAASQHFAQAARHYRVMH